MNTQYLVNRIKEYPKDPEFSWTMVVGYLDDILENEGAKMYPSPSPNPSNEPSPTPTPTAEVGLFPVIAEHIRDIIKSLNMIAGLIDELDDRNSG